MSTGTQDGIILTEDRSVEAQLQRAKEERRKKLKRQKRRKIILFGGAGVILLFIIVISTIISTVMKNMPLTVMTISPEKGDLESVVTASGTIQSEQTIHYYAPAGILVADSVSTGDRVSAGDILILFDEEDFAYALKETELQDKIATNSYQSGLKEYNDNKKKLAAARENVKKYQGLSDAQQAKVNELTVNITDANAIKIANLQNMIYEARKKVEDYNYKLANAQDLGLTQTQIDEYTQLLRREEQSINDLSYEIERTSSGAVAYDQQKQLSQAQNLLSDYKAELEKAKAEVETYEKMLGNQYDAENVVLNGELSTMRTGQMYESMLAYEDGVKADFDGVVTLSSVEPGAKTIAGTEMVTLASLSDIKVTINVTKSNLSEISLGQKASVLILGKEYQGTVTKISGIATAGTNGGSSVQVEIHIDNPDNSIFLGLDAKIELVTASKTDVLRLPVEAVSADKEGEFVYIVSDGVVEKRYVTLGISSDEYVEIVDGLTEEDQVITMISSDIEEGMVVVALPQMSNVEMEPMVEEEE